MAKKIDAWAAEDGSLHETECAAATRDVELLVLSDAGLSANQPYAKEVIRWLTSNAGQIRKTLEAHERACPRTVQAERPTEEAMSAEIKARRDSAIAAMRENREAGRSFLRRHGFSDINDFRDRSGLDDITAWERISDMAPSAEEMEDRLADDLDNAQFGGGDNGR